MAQGSILLLCALLLAIVAVSGCAPASAPPPLLDPPVSSSVQAQAWEAVQGFVADLEGKRYPAAENLFSPSLRAQMTPSALAGDTAGSFKPFVGASDWGVDQYQYLMRGRQVVLRAHFTGADHIVYRTNFILAQSPSGWQIAMILPPAKPPTEHLIVKRKT
jgi:hypothetical protein